MFSFIQLLGNITEWEGLVAPDALQELVLDGLLNRSENHFRSLVQYNCIMYMPVMLLHCDGVMLCFTPFFHSRYLVLSLQTCPSSRLSVLKTEAVSIPSLH